MCRLLAIIDNEGNFPVHNALMQFGELAEKGTVPPDAEAGHKNGWGIAAYERSGEIFLKKDPSSAWNNADYAEAVANVERLHSPLIIGHLRKASRGGQVIENAQPFVLGRYVFCHNGTVRDYEKLALEGDYVAARKGDGDSEVVFLWLTQNISKQGEFADAFREGVKTLRGMDYTAENIIMSDGKTLIAMREANDGTDDKELTDLCDSYYTLFQGKDSSGKTKVICSQELSLPGITWTLIPNHAVLRIGTDGREETIPTEKKEG